MCHIAYDNRRWVGVYSWLDQGSMELRSESCVLFSFVASAVASVGIAYYNSVSIRPEHPVVDSILSPLSCWFQVRFEFASFLLRVRFVFASFSLQVRFVFASFSLQVRFRFASFLSSADCQQVPVGYPLTVSVSPYGLGYALGGLWIRHTASSWIALRTSQMDKELAVVVWTPGVCWRLSEWCRPSLLIR